jgi:type IV pilus assembly protein PilN
MMIRINLLPVRVAKKREMGRQILVLFAAVILAAIVGNYMWYARLADEVSSNAAGIASVKAKITDLEKVIGEVSTINDRKAEVEKKLTVLDNLRRGRSGPVRMLDALSLAMPKKLWLENFTEDKGGVKILGSAVSHDEVAEFMRSLGGMVWTPKGMGRLVEQRRDSKTSRVELLTPDATIEEFPVAAIKPFFSNIDLKDATQQVTKVGGADGTQLTTVKFNLMLTANYAI